VLEASFLEHNIQVLEDSILVLGVDNQEEVILDSIQELNIQDNFLEHNIQVLEDSILELGVVNTLVGPQPNQHQYNQPQYNQHQYNLHQSNLHQSNLHQSNLHHQHPQLKPSLIILAKACPQVPPKVSVECLGTTQSGTLRLAL